MRSYSVELIGGPEDGLILRVSEEAIAARVLRVAVKAPADFVEPRSDIPEACIETVEYQLTGGITPRGCLRAVIAP